MHPIVENLVVPGVAPGVIKSGVALALFWSRNHRRRLLDPAHTPVSPEHSLPHALLPVLAAGVIAGAVMLVLGDRPRLPIARSTDALPWLVPLATLTVLFATFRSVPIPGRALAVVIALFVVGFLAKGRRPIEDAWPAIAWTVALGSFFTSGLAHLARRRDAAGSFPVALCVIGGSLLLLPDIAFIAGARHAGTVGALLSACAAASLLRKDAGASPGLAVFAAVITAGCFCSGVKFGDAPTYRGIFYALCVAVAPWLAVLASRSDLRSTASRVALPTIAAAAPLLVGLVIAFSNR
jgi:hypothetical protein